MCKDGYVLDLQGAKYEGTQYVVLKSTVKPRTNEKDPVTKLPYYKQWIILSESVAGTTSATCVHSAFCNCKGG